MEQFFDNTLAGAVAHVHPIDNMYSVGLSVHSEHGGGIGECDGMGAGGRFEMPSSLSA